MAKIIVLSEVIVLLVLAAAGARGWNVVTVTRKRDGDRYSVYSGGFCEERNCSSEAPFLAAQNSTCQNNISLRKKCTWKTRLM